MAYVPSHGGFHGVRLQDQANLAYSQNVVFQTRGLLQPGELVTAIRLILDAQFTIVGNAGAFGEAFRQMVQRIVIGRRVAISGLGAWALDVMDQGRSGTFPGDISGVTGQVFSKRLEWVIQFLRPNSKHEWDGAIPTELFDDQILAPLSSSGIFGAANAPTLSNATMRCYVETVPAPAKFKMPTSYRIADFPVSALSYQVLEPGAYEHAAIFTATAASRNRITSANITAISTTIDGKPLFTNYRAEDLASGWNRYAANSGIRGTNTPTFPLPFESLDDQPDQAAGSAQASNQMEFVPLVFMPRGYGGTQLPMARSGLGILLAGTITNWTVAVRVRENRDVNNFAKAARRVGITGGAVRVATATGRAVSSEHAAFLPLEEA